MKINKLFLIFILILVILSLSVSILNFTGNKKIGFVLTGELVSKYHGMKEVQDEYNIKYLQWQTEIDTLIALYDSKVLVFKENELKYNKEKRELEREKIVILGDKITNYKKNLEEIATQENQKMIQGALNQINSFVENYGEENNYDYIIGVTEFGNVLYTDKKYNLTEELIKALNDDYTGK